MCRSRSEEKEWLWICSSSNKIFDPGVEQMAVSWSGILLWELTLSSYSVGP